MVHVMAFTICQIPLPRGIIVLSTLVQVSSLCSTAAIAQFDSVLMDYKLAILFMIKRLVT